MTRSSPKMPNVSPPVPPTLHTFWSRYTPTLYKCTFRPQSPVNTSRDLSELLPTQGQHYPSRWDFSQQQFTSASKSVSNCPTGNECNQPRTVLTSTQCLPQFCNYRYTTTSFLLIEQINFKGCRKPISCRTQPQDRVADYSLKSGVPQE